MKKSSESLLRVRSVSKSFKLTHHHSLKERVVEFGRYRSTTEHFNALSQVSFELGVGETLGLVGHNGSGKSTLLKIIGGIIDPTSGDVYRRGRMAALLELGAGFHPDLTGRENIYLNAAILGLTRREAESVFDAIVDFSGIENFIDTQVKFYSSGMYVRLAFSIAVHVDPDLLLVDEVLAVGDQPFQEKCIQRIRDFQSEGRAIVLVTHSPEQVQEICSRVIVMNHGDLVFDGRVEAGLRELDRIYANE